jgi:hypothetical protein
VSTSKARVFVKTTPASAPVTRTWVQFTNESTAVTFDGASNFAAAAPKSAPPCASSVSVPGPPGPATVTPSSHRAPPFTAASEGTVSVEAKASKRPPSAVTASPSTSSVSRYALESAVHEPVEAPASCTPTSVLFSTTPSTMAMLPASARIPSPPFATTRGAFSVSEAPEAHTPRRPLPTASRPVAVAALAFAKEAPSRALRGAERPVTEVTPPDTARPEPPLPSTVTLTTKVTLEAFSHSPSPPFAERFESTTERPGDDEARTPVDAAPVTVTACRSALGLETTRTPTTPAVADTLRSDTPEEPFRLADAGLPPASTESFTHTVRDWLTAST